MSNPPPIRTQNSGMWRRPFQSSVHFVKAVRIHDFSRTNDQRSGRIQHPGCVMTAQQHTLKKLQSNGAARARYRLCH